MDRLTISSVQIEILFDEQNLSFATGFVIEKHERLYLVTNWHVVSGRHHETGKHLDEKYASEPNNIRLRFIGKDGKNKYLLVPLFDSDGNPLWLQSPELARLKNNRPLPIIDVVLIPLEYHNKYDFHIFDLNLANHEMLVAPALPVSVIGFPLPNDYSNFERKNYISPVWITGYIATEPDLNLRDLPLLYINAAGYSGLSGSPVVVRQYGSYNIATGGYAMNTGIQTKFIGVYSGRLPANKGNKDLKHLALCQVWKPEVIDVILKIQAY